MVLSPYLSTPEKASLVTVSGPVYIILSVQGNAYDATVSVYGIDLFWPEKSFVGFLCGSPVDNATAMYVLNPRHFFFYSVV